MALLPSAGDIAHWTDSDLPPALSLLISGFTHWRRNRGGRGGRVPLNIGKCCMCPTQKLAYTPQEQKLYILNFYFEYATKKIFGFVSQTQSDFIHVWIITIRQSPASYSSLFTYSRTRSIWLVERSQHYTTNIQIRYWCAPALNDSTLYEVN